MKSLSALLLFAALSVAPAAADDAKASPTLCLTYRMYLNGQAVAMPQGYDRMMTEKLSKMGYRPTPCATAQIRLSIDMRIVGETRENTRVDMSIEGRYGSRTGHYQTHFSGQQYEEDPTHLVQSMALGLGSVMVEIDPDYTQRLLEKLLECSRQGAPAVK
jgi:hypothetical protein